MQSALLGRKVLIVDDEPPVRELLRRYFARRGFGTLEAGSGADAVELFRRHLPHIVLLDILMPGWDGLKTLAELRQEHPSVKVIIISTLKAEPVFRRCLELGALDYIVKPFHLADLDARVFGKLLW